MNCLVALLMFVAADPAKAADAQPAKDAKPLEEVLSAKEQPNGKHIMVYTNILVHNANGKKGMKVHFEDAKGSPNVNIKQWDKTVKEIKPGTLVKVTGELHFGPVSGGTPSIRYKVKEQSGKKYNDHRHWRTDTAIYIINPTYEVVGQKKADTTELKEDDK